MDAFETLLMIVSERRLAAVGVGPAP